MLRAGTGLSRYKGQTSWCWNERVYLGTKDRRVCVGMYGSI